MLRWIREWTAMRSSHLENFPESPQFEARKACKFILENQKLWFKMLPMKTFREEPKTEVRKSRLIMIFGDLIRSICSCGGSIFISHDSFVIHRKLFFCKKATWKNSKNFLVRTFTKGPLARPSMKPKSARRNFCYFTTSQCEVHTLTVSSRRPNFGLRNLDPKTLSTQLVQAA